MLKKLVKYFKDLFRDTHKMSQYKMKDKLFYLYTHDNGKTEIVTFYVYRIYASMIEQPDGNHNYEFKYEGDCCGANYYGIAPENLVAKSMDELTAKLMKQGYTVFKSK